MNPLEFAGEVILVSASGVLSPGPLFFANIIYGSKQGVTAGFKTAFGHTIVEFPLVIVLASGLFTFSIHFFGLIIGILFFMSYMDGLCLVSYNMLSNV